MKNNWVDLLKARSVWCIKPTSSDNFILDTEPMIHFIETEIIEKLIEDAALTMPWSDAVFYKKQLRASWLGKEQL